jgi:REP element-mobilizing transposase RayT
VTARGNERRDIFRDDRDRDRFLSVLERTVGLFRWRLHAYVLMGNHYHLVLETPEPTLSRGMRQLNGIYTQAFNRIHRRTGHLLQGRFKAVLVEKEAHLLELCRYVVLNPVRAGVVRTAKDWLWSSYRATTGLAKAPAWLETGWTLEQFGSTRERAREAFRRFVADGRRNSYEPWKEVQGQIYLGSTKFRADVLRRARTGRENREAPKAQGRPAPIPKDELLEQCLAALGCDRDSLEHRTRLLADERKAVAHLFRRRGLLKLTEIGQLLGVGDGQASRLAAEGEAVLSRNAALRRRLRDLANDIGSKV